MTVQRRVAAVDCQGLEEQLSMQCFIQEGHWHLDKQMSDFFHFFGLLVSYRTLVNSLRIREASSHGSTRRRESLQRRAPAPEELVAPILAVPRPRREARREARVEHRE